MIRVVIENILLFLLPAAMYVGYVLLTRRGSTSAGTVVSDAPLVWLFVAGALIVAARAAGLAAVPTGLEHGTVTVIASHVPHEVTTLREDIETHGRHATVAFTDDWAADARRRDFTINALYCSADGEVFDPLGAYADLEARRVRFIGEARERIREDYL